MCFYICLLVEKTCDYTVVPAFACVMKRTHEFAVFSFYMGPMGDQQFGHGLVTRFSCYMQWSQLSSISGVNLRSLTKKQARCFNLSLLCCDPQRGLFIWAFSIDVGLLL